jgi:hypothetical protein
VATMRRGIALQTAVLWTCYVVIICAAVAFVFETLRIRNAWPPATWPYSHDVPFITPLIARAGSEWHRTAIILVAWSAAYIVALKCILQQPERKTFPIAIMGVQIVVLLITLGTRIPFNSDQYVYVAYGDLVDARMNPYDPPLKIATLSAQLRAIGTVWSIDEGAPDATKRVVVRDRYGPLFTIATAAVLWPFRDASVELQVWILRLTASIAAIGCSIVLWLWGRRSGRGAAAIAAFSLSPAIVLQVAQGAHNDIYALFFALSAALLLTRHEPVLAAIAIAASVGIKLTFAPFIVPFALYLLAKRGIVPAALSLVAFVGTLGILALPFGLVDALVQPVADIQRFNYAYLVHLLARGVQHLPAALRISDASLATLYDAGLLVCLTAIGYSASRGRAAWRSMGLLLLLIFAAGHLEPWYAMSLAPLLLFRTSWSLPVFAGVSLASQIFQSGGFVGSYDKPPFTSFVVLAVGLVAVLMMLYTDLPERLRLSLAG